MRPKFDENVWLFLVRSLTKIFHFTEEQEKEYLDPNKKKVVRLIAAIPYLAGCQQVARSALCGIVLFVAATLAKEISGATEDDSKNIFQRLNLIKSLWLGGNEDFKKRGVALLALAMLGDYKNDVEVDQKTGKYNPISSGDIDYDVNSKYLQSIVQSIPSKEMDEILTSDEAIRGSWN